MNDREGAIKQLLDENGEVSVEFLSKRNGVSLSTARRDIESLSQSRWYEKSSKGIKIASIFDDHWVPVYKMDIQKSEMLAIANEAVKLVSRGDVIAVSGGRICHQFVLRLRQLEGITVVTNALDIAVELTAIPGIQVAVTGGVLNNDSFELVGKSVATGLENIIINKFFLGTHGIFVEHGLTAHDELEAQAIRDIMHHSEKSIVLADSSKYSQPSFAKALPISQVNSLVTTNNVDPEIIKEFREAGVEVFEVLVNAPVS